ncbi:MAG: hypothetical protein QXN32_00635 [Candidatus Nitrosocaldus sp.]
MDNSSINVDNVGVDSCKHRIIYDQEWVCCKCGRIFSNEEVEELQRGSMEVTAIKSLESIGLDLHGKTPLWLHGLGSIEGYKQEKDQGSREDISIISNIADKLQLPSYTAQEFLLLYRSFVKERKDRVLAAKLALLLLTTECKELVLRIRRMLAFIYEEKEEEVSDYECYKYMIDIVNQQFNTTTNKKDSEEDLSRLLSYLQIAPNFARKYGIARAVRINKITSRIIKQRRRR